MIPVLTEHGWVEIISLVSGAGAATLVLKIGGKRGIGPQLRLTLAVCLIVPMIVILGLEKILTGETIAAIVGALIGAGGAGSAVSSSSPPSGTDNSK
jgi:hypothetical protein